MASISSKIVTALRPKDDKVHDDPRAVLSESEQKMYDEIFSHFANPEYKVPNFAEGELMEAEKFWLSRECLLRFLRATKWKVADAIIRLEATLKWRREFGIYDLVSADLVEPEAVTGKEILFGYDVTGKPALYMVPSRQNTTEATRQIQYVFWMLERAIDLMEPGVETVALLINFADRGKNPSISTSLSVLSILQNHYPERLGLAVIINIPFFVNAFFKMVMPLVDPITRAKVKFNPQVFKDGLFTEDNMMSEWWGGAQDFEYKHENYWTDLVTLCEARSTAWKNNWRALGAKLGESEWAYKKYASSPPVDPLDEKKIDNVTATEVQVQATPDAKKESGTSHSTAEAQVASPATASATTATAGAVGAVAGNADAGAGGDAGAE